ncbi:MAG: cation diffusion facilitator family transporter [Bacteroidota bacterium]
MQKWITLISILLFIAKMAAYIRTNSTAVLSDALESVVNVIAGFIGLVALYIAAKPRDKSHPYGHGKAEFISAAAEGALIIFAGFFILYETVIHFIEQTPVLYIDEGLYIIASTAVVNLIAGLYCIQIGKKNNSLALHSSGKHLLLDTLSTLLIIVALGIMYLVKIFWIDKATSFVMALIVLYNGYKIIRKSLAGIMDEADEKLLQDLVSLLNDNRHAKWIDLHNLRVIKYGPVLHIDCHMTVPWYLNVREAHTEIDALILLIKTRFGDAVEMFIHTDACMKFSCAICMVENCPVRLHPFEKSVDWTMKNIISNEKHSITQTEI